MYIKGFSFESIQSTEWAKQTMQLLLKLYRTIMETNYHKTLSLDHAPHITLSIIQNQNDNKYFCNNCNNKSINKGCITSKKTKRSDSHSKTTNKYISDCSCWLVACRYTNCLQSKKTKKKQKNNRINFLRIPQHQLLQWWLCHDYISPLSSSPTWLRITVITVTKQYYDIIMTYLNSKNHKI